MTTGRGINNHGEIVGAYSLNGARHALLIIVQVAADLPYIPCSQWRPPARALSRLDFTGHQVHELHGQRDMSYSEVTTIIGKAIGQPNLKYVKLTREQFIGALTQMGMSENSASLLAEMSESMDSGYIKPLEPRSPRTTTPTSYETFVAESFLPNYQQKRRAA